MPRSDGRTDMKTLIQELLDRRNAYVAIGTEGKEVLFDVTSMPDYGALSGRKLEDQKAGARIAVDAHKKNPGDFVLWKESGAKEPGWNGKFEFVPNPNSGYDAEFTVSRENASELGLNSPSCCDSRPSGLAHRMLGDECGLSRQRLRHPRRRSRSHLPASRKRNRTIALRPWHPAMANFWMHNGFLQVEGEKMSKSLGNFHHDPGDCLNDWPGDVLRFKC